MQPGVGPDVMPETQYIQNTQNPPVVVTQYAQPIALQPQIVYVLKYRPESGNMRHWSYLAFFAGVVIYFGSMMFGAMSDSNVFFLLGESLCCLSFGLGFFLDAAFYKGKSDWESSTGQSNGGSTTGMIFDILFGIIAVVIALFVLIGVSTFST